MKRKYTRTLVCSQEGCKEVGFWNFDTKRELEDHYERIKQYRCTRHTRPETVLSKENLQTKTTIVCVEKLMDGGRPLGNFWQEEKDFGTSRLSSGFQYGNGYKAFASDFPKGTVITITASVALPNETPTP